jgi:flavin reductase (DIM6/NTAB) family NADH-FMN oxidoreductase RutF/rubredoxin
LTEGQGKERLREKRGFLQREQPRKKRRGKLDVKAFHKISYGLYVVGVRDGEKRNGQIANTLFQVCADPPLVAVAINKKNFTHEFLAKTRRFSASILSEEAPLKFIGLFGFNSGRDINKFEKVQYKDGATGVPIVVDYTIGYLEAEVTDTLDVMTHTLFVGKVVEAEVTGDASPLTYADYHAVKRGKTPKTAPSYTGESSQPAGNGEKYRCKVCGYVYDPAVGDPDADIEPGTPFEKLPPDWICPVCGAAKGAFEKIT